MTEQAELIRRPVVVAYVQVASLGLKLLIGLIAFWLISVSILALLLLALFMGLNLYEALGYVKGLIAATWQVPIAFAPLVVYGIAGLKIRSYLGEVPPDHMQMEPDKQQAASLTLAGFCFTSLSLLVSFFKEAIQRGETGPEGIILFFCCALVCFVASYMTLRFRTKNLFGFVSDGFIDNGFWCVMVGLLTFFGQTPGMRRPAAAVALLLALYSAYFALNILYHVQYVRNPNRQS